ncbi:hypothetical protein HMPREF0731_2312, partial [Pseudoroseomonas cervicalis ATCC 49957]
EADCARARPASPGRAARGARRNQARRPIGVMGPLSQTGAAGKRQSARRTLRAQSS